MLHSQPMHSTNSKRASKQASESIPIAQPGQSTSTNRHRLASSSNIETNNGATSLTGGIWYPSSICTYYVDGNDEDDDDDVHIQQKQSCSVVPVYLLQSSSSRAALHLFSPVFGAAGIWNVVDIFVVGIFAYSLHLSISLIHTQLL